MMVEIVVFVIVVAAVAFWGLRSIVRSVRAGSCGGSNSDGHSKCGQCPSVAKSHCPEDTSCQGGD